MPKQESRQLLIGRAEARHLLGDISESTIIRLEKTGKLPPMKLADAANGRTFYRAADIRALAGADQVEVA